MNTELEKRFWQAPSQIAKCRVCGREILCVEVDLLMYPRKTVTECHDCFFGGILREDDDDKST